MLLTDTRMARVVHPLCASYIHKAVSCRTGYLIGKYTRTVVRRTCLSSEACLRSDSSSMLESNAQWSLDLDDSAHVSMELKKNTAHTMARATMKAAHQHQVCVPTAPYSCLAAILRLVLL